MADRPPPASIYRPTRCGVCLKEVILTTAEGYHALLELDGHGLKVPHACPESAVRSWERINNSVLRLIGIINCPGEVP